jgi:polar amino acid transport system substrate-binding protein
MKWVLLLVLFFIGMVNLLACSAVTDVRVITEEFPPFNFTADQGNITGQSTEIVHEILKRLGKSTKIEIMPWSQGYAKASEAPDIALFSVVRTPSREDKFKWVGPVGTFEQWFFKYSGLDLQISTLDDVRKVRAVGVYRDDVSHQYLAEKGFTNLDISEDDIECVKKLSKGQIDVWLGQKEGLPILAEKSGISMVDLKPVFFVQKVDLNIAFSKGTSDATVVAWQKMLDTIKLEKYTDGSSVYEKIISHYQQPQYTENPVTKEQVIDLIDRASFAIAGNVQSAFSDINSGKAPYKDDKNQDLYIFVFNPDVVVVAHADNKLMINKNMKGKGDILGNKFRDSIVYGALQNKTGWVDYVYTKTGASGLFYKSAYYKLTIGSDGNKYIVGAGRFKDVP